MIELSETINLNTNKPIFRSEIRNVWILLTVLKIMRKKHFIGGHLGFWTDILIFFLGQDVFLMKYLMYMSNLMRLFTV